jgi:hypothetical protein
MNEKKLSELMEQGAAKLAPYNRENQIGDIYFDSLDNPQAADAIGCMLYQIGMVNPQGLLYDTLPEYLRDTLYTQIDLNELPTDARSVWEAIPHFSWERILLKLIVCVNLNISRERAIQLVKELGY